MQAFGATATFRPYFASALENAALHHYNESDSRELPRRRSAPDSSGSIPDRICGAPESRRPIPTGSTGRNFRRNLP